jgi:CDP-paratose 2-epimerase
MDVAVVTGSAGLIGAEAVRVFADRGLIVVGVDNDMRGKFFGGEASTKWQSSYLQRTIPGYQHFDIDIRDAQSIGKLFSRYNSNISLVLHCAAQPSHDWAAREPMTDFSVNAQGTLILLEATRTHCPDAVFIFTSTNKVYGDHPNLLPLIELKTRYELDNNHPFGEHGIDESMPLDQSLHSIFGASKAAADLMVQEYGRYFGMKTACFRGGCLTGSGHSATQLHGFLAYLVQCALTGTPYTVMGYQGKQVRDHIHSKDLVEAFWHFFQRPRVGEVFNIGGSRHANCSILEAISMVVEITGRPLNWSYDENNRIGDHMWWISDVRKFQSFYPDWSYAYDIKAIIGELHEGMRERLKSHGSK